MVQVRGLGTALLLLLAASRVAYADDVSAAREHYMKGTRAFDLGHYKEAVDEYEAAYTAKDDPALLFNIAQAYRLMGDNENAIRTYKSFLNRMPNSENRADVERRIAELQTLVDGNARAKAAPPRSTLPPQDSVAVGPVAPTDDPQRARRLKIAGLTTGAVGVALLAAGGGFTAAAKSAADDIDHPANGVFSPSAEQRRDTFEALDVTCFVVGGVALATGLTVYLLGRRAAHGRGAHATRGLQLAEGGR